MKDLDTAGAPMISVPAGILKEFMSPANSRTPTPPLTNISSTTSSTTTTTTTVTGTSSNIAPSPVQTLSLTGNLTTALQNITPSSTKNGNLSSEVATKSRTPTPTSRTASPSLPLSKDLKTSLSSITVTNLAVTNGKVETQEEEDKENVEDSKSDSNDSSMINGLLAAAADVSNSISSGPSSPSSLTVGVKRPAEDEDGDKSDLKKLRVNKIDQKNELKVTAKEVLEALDNECKKVQEVKISNNQSLATLSFIKNGIAKISGKRVPSTDSPSTTPSPAATPDLQVEDAATPEQTAVLGQEHGLANKENVKASRSRERKLEKNELKDAILRVFSENTLYGSEMGHLKQMCEKLTSTLEINMRKVAQFHKEIEDLRKVTTRLASEHQARKGQYVAPIRIKRSVGIQAAPHIINKGIMHANVSGGNIKTIAPRSSNMVNVLPSSVGQNIIPGGTVGIITTNSGIRPTTLTGIPVSASSGIASASSASLGTAVRTHNGQIMMMAPAGTMQSLTRPTAGVVNTTTMVPVGQGRVVRAPIANLSTVAPQPGTLIGPQRPLLIQNDKTVSSPTLHSALTAPITAPKGSGVIDLTDEDEGAKAAVNRAAVIPKPGTLVKVPTSGTAQFVPLQAGGVGQVVLLPNTSGGQPTTALIVSQVSAVPTQESTTGPAIAQARTTYVTHTSTTTPRVQGATPPAPSRTSLNTPSPTAVVQQTHTGMRHPAPLPKTPFQQVGGISKKLPPMPTLKLSHKDSSIVLSWTMAKTEDHETIASYQLYAYQEGENPPSANLWKKVGSVKALELPMACTLTQFMPGHVYHFAVRAVDIKSRLGPFSDPKSIRLDKK